MPIEDHEIEEYLEAIFKIAGPNGVAKTTEIAKAMDVAPASVTEVVKRLSEKGFVK